MKNYLYMIAGLLLLAAIFSVATASIGIQCYNKCESPNMNKEHSGNKAFLVINLILSLVFLFVSMALIYFIKVMPESLINTVAKGINISPDVGNELGNVLKENFKFRKY
jgi:hypothetical protein